MEIVGVTGFRGLWALNCGRHRFLRFVGVSLGVANFYLGRSKGLRVANFFFILASKLAWQTFFGSTDRY